MPWIIHLFTSFRGRISRKSWWIGIIILEAVSIAGSLAIYKVSGVTFDWETLQTITSDLKTLQTIKSSIWFGVWQIALFFPAMAITLKRLHDRDHSPWIGYAWGCLLLAAAIAAYLGFLSSNDQRAYSTVERSVLGLAVLFLFWVFIDNGFLKGTPGPNRYGTDPLGGSKPSTSAASRRTRGSFVRDGIVALFGLVIIAIPVWNYYTTPKAVFDRAQKQSLRKLPILSRMILEDEMRANASAWSAFTTGKFVARKDKAAALVHYSTAIEIYGKESRLAGRVLMWRGHSLRKLGRSEEALEDYSTAIALQPDFAHRYSYRARTYFALKRFDDALRDYDTAIRLDPQDADYHIGRGNALRTLGKPDQALTAYENAIAAARDGFASIERGSVL